MDFDNKVAEGISHLDVSPNLFYKVDFSFLACCSQNWLSIFATITPKSAHKGGDKDLGIIDNCIADNIAFQTRSSHGVWQLSFSNYFEMSASLSTPKTWSALSITSLNPWLTKNCKLTRLCSLANVSRFASRILMAASGRSYLMISFNICTITCAVASYVHYMISFEMCWHSCVNSWFGYRCRSSRSSSLLFCLRCAFSM